MKITKELLKEKRACAEGEKAFNRFFPDGFDVSLWTAEFQMRIIKKTRLRKYIGWAHRSGLIPLSNLCGSNLRGSDLRGAIYSKYTILPTNFDPKSAGMLWVET